MSIYFLQPSYYHKSVLAKFASAPFFLPPPAPSGRPPDWGWGRPACFSAPANPPTVRTLSEMVKKPWRSSLWLPGTFWIAPSSSPHKTVWSLSWPTSWERQILVKCGVNRFSRHIRGLSEFHDTLLMIILHFGGGIGDGHLRCEGVRRGRWTADWLLPIRWKIKGKGWNKSFIKQRALYKIFYQKSSPPDVTLNI